MPYARSCECPRPTVFANDPDTCQRCGRPSPTPVIVTPSTMRIALAIGEVFFGKRKIGDEKHRGRRPSKTSSDV